MSAGPLKQGLGQRVITGAGFVSERPEDSSHVRALQREGVYVGIRLENLSTC